MPPKKAKPRPNTWKVVGGSQSGGLIVRQGPETKSEELAERLSTGALVHELELQGERMRYRRVKGSGPETGWISTKFKGKDQLKRHKLKAWILATGTRGDLQPYLALALGLQDAGYEMTIWTCEDYKKFVEDYKIRMRKIAESVEDRIKNSFQGNDKGKKAKTDGNEKNAKKETEEEKSIAVKAKTLNARWHYAVEFGVTCGGIQREGDLPEEIKKTTPKEVLLYHYVDRVAIYSYLGETDNVEHYTKMAEEIKAELEAEEAIRAKENGQEPTTKEESKTEADRDQNPEEWWEEKKKSAGPALTRVIAEAEGWIGAGYLEQAIGAIDMFETQRGYWTAGEYEDWKSMAYGSIDGLFLHDLASDPTILQGFVDEMKASPPDVILYNLFWNVLAAGASQFLDVPMVQLSLQTQGLYLTDPAGAWMTEEFFPTIQQMDPALQVYPSLEEARKHHSMPEEYADLSFWSKYVLFEEFMFEPLLKVHPIRDMGPTALMRIMTQRHLIGFLSSIASDRFVSFLGEYSKKMVAKHHYSGFWIMDEKHQTGAGASDMFGGSDLMKTVEDFISAGSPPAYIGWGSCVCMRGREWMILLAVGALKQAGMRGIVLGGWAELSLELLEELCAGDTSDGLVEYARKNILFIKKAPQVWLFPKCSVVVIHGGVGTLAAAWTSGTPLIVCPVWLDQFPNSFLNSLMGAGVMSKSVDETSITELAGAMQHAATDPAVKRGAQAVQFSMMMDKGIQDATEYIDNVILEEFPSGRWSQWWL